MKIKHSDFIHPHHPTLFLMDYDGTLTDFKKNPKESRISHSLRALLYRLQKKFFLVIVTGRYIDNLIQLSGLKKFPIIGTHGFEARNLPQHLTFATPHLKDRYQKEAHLLWQAVQDLSRIFPGIHIEKKPFSSTLHYRGSGLSQFQIQKLKKKFLHLCRENITSSLWTVQKGKQMVEMMPRGFSKGKAVRALLKQFPHHQIVSAGDDLSDISVFKTLGKKGLKIAVGNRIPSKNCDIRFETPKDFIAWLQQWDR